MGGFPNTPQDVSDNRFKLLVICAKERLDFLGDPSEEATAQAYGCTTVHAPFDDDQVDSVVVEQVGRAVGKVVTALRRGSKVLVTCNQGRNRSGLVSALALLQISPKFSPNSVIKLIKDRRVAPSGKEALTNPDFCELIQTWRPRRRSRRRKNS